MLQLKNVKTLLVLNHLSRYGAVFSRPWFCVQQPQDFKYSGSYKVGASKVSS